MYMPRCILAVGYSVGILTSPMYECLLFTAYSTPVGSIYIYDMNKVPVITPQINFCYPIGLHCRRTNSYNTPVGNPASYRRKHYCWLYLYTQVHAYTFNSC